VKETHHVLGQIRVHILPSLETHIFKYLVTVIRQMSASTPHTGHFCNIQAKSFLQRQEEKKCSAAKRANQPLHSFENVVESKYGTMMQLQVQ
jgi:hypothetical protein